MNFKKVTDLPSSFEELGMPKTIAAIFEIAGKTLKEMLEGVRILSFHDELEKRNGKLFYMPKDLNPYRYFTEIPTGIEDVPSYWVETGSLMSGYGSAKSLKINFLEVATPYFTDYIREDALELRNSLNESLEKAFLTSWCISSLGLIHAITDKFYLENYDILEKVRINEEPIKEFLNSYFDKKQLKEYAKARKTVEKTGEFFETGPLWSRIRHITTWWVEPESIKKALYVLS